MLESRPQRLLVVCYGNLCRSPMVEGLLRDRLPDAEWRVSSAGTHALPGSPPAPLAAAIMEELAGIDIEDCRSTPLSVDLVRAADHVFTMSFAQAREVAALCPEARSRVRLFGAFAPQEPGPRNAAADPGGPTASAEEVPDPMGGELEEYRRCYDRLSRAADACARWLTRGADPAAGPPSLADLEGDRDSG